MNEAGTSIMPSPSNLSTQQTSVCVNEAGTSIIPSLSNRSTQQTSVCVNEAGTSLSKYCYCNEGEHGEMIGCDNKSCPYKWFHLDYLRLQSLPKSKMWYCPDCRKRRKCKKN